MKLTKAERHQAIRDRAIRALGDMYHNATLPCIRDLHGRSEDDAQSWIDIACQLEIEYMRDGGAYGTDFRKTLAAPCNAGKFTSEKARRYYVARGMRKMTHERNDCGAVTGWYLLENAALFYGRGIVRAVDSKRNNALWDRIGEYGNLYQWGRGGRTLAPDGLISQRGGSSFIIREDAATECSIADCIELIRIVESFNRYVTAWCAYVPRMWDEYCADADAEALAEKRAAAARKAKETRERNYWACRDVMTV